MATISTSWPMAATLAYYKGDWLGIHATASVLRSDFGHVRA